MASASAKDRITRLSCRNKVEVEASVTRYCNARPHVNPIFPDHNQDSLDRLTNDTCFEKRVCFSDPFAPLLMKAGNDIRSSKEK
jgi:hypothetical protein